MQLTKSTFSRTINPVKVLYFSFPMEDSELVVAEENNSENLKTERAN